jgi:ATPase subunit of ABC transporter with duplicated ATPase domains
MPASLHARHITLSLGSRTILADLDLALHPGRRVGVIGPNGVGKSTLLRVLAGLQTADVGTVSLTPPDATVGYLDQEPQRGSELVSEFVHRRTGVAAAQAELDNATRDLPAGTASVEARYTAAFDRWMALGAADLDSRVGETWSELGLPDQLVAQPMGSLSGGEAARVGLAALMLARFDVLLLDEPTNDLDLDSLGRLEDYVLTTPCALAVVSHDRQFLRRVVTDVAELDEFTHQVTFYAGGYESYLDERQTAQRHAWEAWEEYDAKRSSLLQRAQRQREWAAQGLKRAKKQPKDNDKNIKAFKINQTEQLAARAARTERALDRLDAVEQPRQPWDLRMTIADAPRSGTLVAGLTDAVVQRGSFRLGPVDVTVDYGERVVIVGPNGSGKTTLLDALLGEVRLSSGRQRLGPSVRIGRMEQTRQQLGQTAVSTLDAFQSRTRLQTSDARSLLAKFGIGVEHVHRSPASLSPGERTRLVLAEFMAVGCNCLVLDEPTNHLDLPAIEQLEQAIDGFPGTVLLVTHDRALLDHVRRTRTISIAAGRIVSDVAE